ncbi:hypothetical protein SAMN05428978_11202 [Nitrosomonas sp. Nm34]|nr:hypothetical protein SAMN05428978_11202 [Nitrosomonas sp. Nm34]
MFPCISVICYVNIFCEQRSIVTKQGKQAIREADTRQYEFLEVPLK